MAAVNKLEASKGKYKISSEVNTRKMIVYSQVRPERSWEVGRFEKYVEVAVFQGNKTKTGERGKNQVYQRKNTFQKYTKDTTFVWST